MLSPGVYVREVDLSQVIQARYFQSQPIKVPENDIKIWRVYDILPPVKEWILATFDDVEDVRPGEGFIVLTDQQYTLLNLKYTNRPVSDFDMNYWDTI